MSTYKRVGCQIDIEPEARALLEHNNVNIDSFANHLYLFLTNQPMDCTKKARVALSRSYKGDGHLYISFETFQLPNFLIPKPEDTTRLREVLAEEPQPGVLTYEKFQKLLRNSSTPETPQTTYKNPHVFYDCKYCPPDKLITCPECFKNHNEPLEKLKPDAQTINRQSTSDPK